ncbi:porphobilinogen deaminase [Auriculariales sp. MPI-PUGE-AT-0066]|nr:porphobilinogen deaminase [Auriculariales sp. MPI-PUGE-AT-0066]
MAESTTTTTRPVVKIGGRQSKLALWQSRTVQARLTELFPEYDFQLSAKASNVAGDRDKVRTLRSLNRDAESSGTSIWTTELEDALIAGELDLLVHALKDCPTTVREGCEIIPILDRENSTDCLVVKAGLKYTSLDELPEGSLVGTGSIRRIAQLKKRYPGLKFQDLRGNIESRLAKLDDPESPYVVGILASAGLIRIDLGHRIVTSLGPPILYPAVSQGVLGAEVLTSNAKVRAMAAALEVPQAGYAARAERALLRELEGGCAVPIGVWTTVTKGGVDSAGAGTASEEWTVSVQAILTSPDGSKEVRVEESALVRSATDAAEIGTRAAVRIAAGGGREIMDKLRDDIAKASKADADKVL